MTKKNLEYPILIIEQKSIAQDHQHKFIIFMIQRI